MTSTKTARDLCALGAAALPTRDLLALALRVGRGDDELLDAERALALHGAAREAALRALKAGPQLLAVVELGRRAWMLPSPAGRRVRGPVDVAAVVAPRAVDDELWLLALDVRLTVARIATVPDEPGALLRTALAAGASRFALARRRPSRAVPTTDDAAFAARVASASAALDATFLDYVLLGDDGFSSLLRLGLVPATDPRYR